MKRMLWWLGLCRLVWLYNRTTTPTRDPMARLRIMWCDQNEDKYAYSILRYRLENDGTTSWQNSNDGMYNKDGSIRWKEYKPGNKPKPKIEHKRLRWCR